MTANPRTFGGVTIVFLTACKFVSIINLIMNTQSLIPLVATIVYIPLFIILLANRPWQSKQKFFLLFLIPAILWSMSDIFFRGNFFMQDKLFLLKIVLCTGIWMSIQYRYLLQSFYKSQVAKMPFAYIIPAAAATLAALGYIPQGITVTSGGIDIDYGNWIFLLIGIIFIIASKDFYHVIRKIKVSADAVERNQIIYSLVGMGCLIAFGFVSVAVPALERYPVAHIGNFLNACVLTYAIVTYRLLDIRVAFRRAIVNLALYGSGIGIVLLMFWLASGFGNIVSFFLAIVVGVPAVFLWVHS